MLVSVDYAGQTFRWSTKPVVIEDVNGDSLSFDGGLNELDFETVLQTLADAPDQTSISLDLMWPVDIAKLVSNGHDLSTARGELSAWIEGNTYENRQVLVSGRVRQPIYAAYNEPVSFTIEEAPFEDVAEWPPSSQRINKETWPRYRDAEVNRPYVQVIGRPGVYTQPDGTVVEGNGTRAQVVETRVGDSTQASTLLIAGHRVKSPTVRIYYVGAEGWTPDEGLIEIGAGINYERPVSYRQDGLGNYVSTVDISGAAAEICRSVEFQVQWVGAAEGENGGLVRTDSGGLTRGAGDVMEYVLKQSTLRVDWGRFNAVRQKMNAYFLDFFMDSNVSPWEWISDNLLPLMPVSMHSGAQGLYPVFWDYAATSRDAVDSIEHGPGVVRVSGMEYQTQPSKLRNKITLKYGYDVVEGEHQRSAIHTPDPDLTDSEQITSEFAKRSKLQYGLKAESIFTSEVVNDDATAHKVTNWRILAEAFSHRSITYEVSQEYAYLELGSVILLTDAELYLQDVVALVQGNQINDTGRIDLTLQIVENVARGNKSTGPSPDQGQADPGDYA
jgi:hypothetical protein